MLLVCKNVFCDKNSVQKNKKLVLCFAIFNCVNEGFSKMYNVIYVYYTLEIVGGSISPPPRLYRDPGWSAQKGLNFKAIPDKRRLIHLHQFSYCLNLLQEILLVILRLNNIVSKVYKPFNQFSYSMGNLSCKY